VKAFLPGLGLAVVVAGTAVLVHVGAPATTVHVGAPATTDPATCSHAAPSGPAALYKILQACGWPKDVDSLPDQVRTSLGQYVTTGADPLNPTPPPPTASYGPRDAVAALKSAAQNLMDAAAHADTARMLPYLDRDCDSDTNSASKAAAQLDQMANGIAVQIEAVFVLGTMGGIAEYDPPANASEQVKRYVQTLNASHSNDWTLDSQGHWVLETSCIPIIAEPASGAAHAS
jgi:hypothetical protein